MNTIEIVEKASPALTDAVARILAAEKSGNRKELSDALRVGGIASMIVEKGTAIANNPERFDKAQEVKTESIVSLGNASERKDLLAMAEGVLRLKSAERSLSAVNKVDALFVRLTTPKVRKSRKVRANLIH